jgi:hypothetical protein
VALSRNLVSPGGLATMLATTVVSCAALRITPAEVMPGFVVWFAACWLTVPGVNTIWRSWRGAGRTAHSCEASDQIRREGHLPRL